MPKTKKQSSSDSDSGPDDRNPPPKKQKVSSKKSSKGSDDDGPSWQLEGNRFVKVREFRGKVMVDIREYYEKDGQLLPGKKGISLSAKQWQKFKDVLDEVDSAVSAV